MYDRLKEKALFEYYNTVSANEPVCEAVAVHLEDGQEFAAGTLSIWTANNKACTRQSADEALLSAVAAHYGENIPKVVARVRVTRDEQNPLEPTTFIIN